MTMSWKPEVHVSGKWCGNGLVFATEAEAAQEASDLMDRWFAVADSRAVESDEPVTHTYVDHKLGWITP
jgi:hypothetical protein